MTAMIGRIMVLKVIYKHSNNPLKTKCNEENFPIF